MKATKKPTFLLDCADDTSIANDISVGNKRWSKLNQK